MLDDTLDITGLAIDASPSFPPKSFSASFLTSMLHSLYLFGVIPFPNVFVIWFAVSNATTMFTMCSGTSANVADHINARLSRSKRYSLPLHPGSDVRG